LGLADFMDILKREAIVTKQRSFDSDSPGRRRFLRALASGTTFLFAGWTPNRSEAQVKTGSSLATVGEEVSPGEDLMREHGVLRRILLVYGEAVRRLEANKDLPLEALANSAGIIRSFIEDYHEKLEEDYLFPRFKKANKLVDLVDILLEQHRAGRRLTGTVLLLSKTQHLSNTEDRKALADALNLFIRMYDPHAAREDTVLFPALHEIVPAKEYGELGEDFEDKEHELFGEGGFEKIVDRVAAIERGLGIYDLSQFTPKE
jgi:hemerythrin-like domain-containing protein